MAPYTLNAPIGMAVLIGSIDTTLSAMADGKSSIEWADKVRGKYAE